MEIQSINAQLISLMIMIRDKFIARGLTFTYANYIVARGIAVAGDAWTDVINIEKFDKSKHTPEYFKHVHQIAEELNEEQGDGLHLLSPDFPFWINSLTPIIKVGDQYIPIEASRVGELEGIVPIKFTNQVLIIAFILSGTNLHYFIDLKKCLKLSEIPHRFIFILINNNILFADQIKKEIEGSEVYYIEWIEDEEYYLKIYGHLTIINNSGYVLEKRIVNFDRNIEGLIDDIFSKIKTNLNEEFVFSYYSHFNGYINKEYYLKLNQIVQDPGLIIYSVDENGSSKVLYEINREYFSQVI